MKLAKVCVSPRRLLVGCKLAENRMGDSRALVAEVLVSPKNCWLGATSLRIGSLPGEACVKRLLVGGKLAKNLDAAFGYVCYMRLLVGGSGRQESLGRFLRRGAGFGECVIVLPHLWG